MHRKQQRLTAAQLVDEVFQQGQVDIAVIDDGDPVHGFSRAYGKGMPRALPLDTAYANQP